MIYVCQITFLTQEHGLGVNDGSRRGPNVHDQLYGRFITSHTVDGNPAWEQIGLLPPVPFVINPNCSRTKRRLYPEHYLEELGRIIDPVLPRCPARLLREDCWKPFQTNTCTTPTTAL